MNLKLKYILSGVAAIIISSFIYSFYSFYRYKYTIEFDHGKRYLWLFNDSTKSEIDTLLSYGFVKENNKLFSYQYKKDYHIYIWEFNDLRIAELNKISINKNINFSYMKFDSGLILDKDNPKIITKKDLIFNDKLLVYLNEKSCIIDTISSTNYKGFYGNINKMYFSNESDENLILFDYGVKIQPAIFLLYKGNNSFYMLLITSNKELDKKIINILNIP